MCQAGKYTHGKYADDGTTHAIPEALGHAFERLILGRQLLGEENDTLFAQSILLDLISLWNENIEQLREEYAQKIAGKALSELESGPDAESDGAQQAMSAAAMAALKETMNEMKTVNIVKTPNALRTLDLFLLFWMHTCIKF